LDERAAKRVDGVYRNIKQLPLLGCFGILIPFIGVIMLPLAISYTVILNRLLRDYESGKIIVENHDRKPVNGLDISTEEKLQFLKSDETWIWVPYLVGALWLPIVIFVIVMMIQNV
jgi:hypothetical protein